MKFNINKIINEAKDEVGFKVLNKILYISLIAFIPMCLFTFFPVDNMNLFLDLLGYSFKLFSLILFIVVLRYQTNIVIKQIKFKKSINNIINISICLTLNSIYIILFVINVMSLYI